MLIESRLIDGHVFCASEHDHTTGKRGKQAVIMEASSTGQQSDTGESLPY